MTAPNTVRVTLTADDEATEVVRRLGSAVKQLDAQNRAANSSTKDSAAASKSAASGMESLARGIEGVVAALGAAKVLEFVRDTIHATDEIGHLSEQTGVSSEKLSALALAANEADLSTSDLGNALKFLSRSTSELQAGSETAAAAFRSIGLSAADLKGLSLDQVLLKVADAQAKFGDGAGKTAAFMQIFGRSGQELIPLLHDLAESGFDPLLKKAADLGFVISAQDVRAAKDFQIATTEMQFAIRGAVLAISPLVEKFADLVKGVAQFIGQHPNFTAFAVGAGAAAAGITLLAGALGLAAVAAGVLEVSLGPIIIGILAIAALVGGIAAVTAALKRSADAAKQFGVQAKDAATSGLPQVNLANPAVEKAIRDARIAAAQQQAKTELAITQAKNKQQEQADEAAFAAGLVSLGTFFAERQAIVRKGVAAEIAALDAERVSLQRQLTAPGIQQADRIRITSQIKAIEGQIATTRINGETQINALLEEERQKRLALQTEIQNFSAQVAKAQGEQVKADQIGIAETVRQFQLALVATGALTAQQIKDAGASLSTLLTNRAAFDEEQRQGQRALAELDLQRQAIQDKINTGLISEHEGQLEIAAVERDRLPVLQKMAQAMLFFAEQVGDPALILAAKQFAAQFATIGTVVTEADRQLANLGDSLAAAGQGELANFLGSTITQVHSLGEAFTQLGSAIVGAFQRVLAEIVASQVVQFIRGLFSSGTPVGLVAGAAAVSTSAAALGGAGGILLTAAAALSAAAAELAAGGVADMAGFIGPLLGFAGGGAVRGPGTSTSDSILARLSAGEFVLNAASVRRLGLPFVTALNGATSFQPRRFSSGVPAFSGGGLASGSDASVSGSLDATFGLEDGLVLKHLSSRGGVRGLAQILSANPKLFRASLGLG